MTSKTNKTANFAIGAFLGAGAAAAVVNPLVPHVPGKILPLTVVSSAIIVGTLAVAISENRTPEQHQR